MAEKKKEVVTTDKKELTMSGYFTSELDRISGALPESFNKQRFALNFVSLINDKPELKAYSKEELGVALVRSAQDNLDALNNEVYIYKGYSGKLTYTISYKGLRKMAIEKSVKPISNIYAKLIKEGDEVDEEFVDGQAHIHYKSKFGNTGAILGVFAVCVFKDGTEIYEVMTKEEIDACKDKSRNSGAWKDFYGEMAKKSAIRRLCKNITLDFRDKQQADMFTGADEFINDPKEQAEKDIAENANQKPLDDEVVAEVVVSEDGQQTFIAE
jgi:recombination protein RecT